jgi:hypothetical protein
VDRTLTALESLDNRGHAVEKRCRRLFRFDALVENRFRTILGRLEERSLRAMRDLGTHEDPDLVQLLPLAIELQKASNLEVASGNVEALREQTNATWQAVRSARSSIEAVVDAKEDVPLAVEFRGGGPGLTVRQ